MKREDHIGRVIAGKYRITSMLGEGGMGVVWRADQIDAQGQTLREVAVKTIRTGGADQYDDVLVRRFQREVRAAMRLTNPHAVTVHDLGQEPDGEMYFVMELVDGPTLKEAMKHGLSAEHAVTIASQVCEALAEAHGLPEPVVHRDLKPANLFLHHWPRLTFVKVGDFGIAKVIGEETSGLTNTGSSLGTPLYMSPEQWKGEAIDGRADLYALGVLLYQMAAGRTPFQGDTMTLMYQHLHNRPAVLPTSVPLPLRLLIDSLLAKDPQERPASAEEVLGLLLAVPMVGGAYPAEGPITWRAALQSSEESTQATAQSHPTVSKTIPPAARRMVPLKIIRLGLGATAAVLTVAGGLRVAGVWGSTRLTALRIAADAQTTEAQSTTQAAEAEANAKLPPIAAAEPIGVGRVLAPPPPSEALVGGLQVVVNAPDAKVSIDGKPAGEATPTNALNIKDVPVGDVRVRVEAAGYDAVEQKFSVRQGEWTTAKLVLGKREATIVPPLVTQKRTLAQDAAIKTSGHFTDRGDGTIADTRSRLEWEKLSDDGSIHDKDNQYTWEQALERINGLNAQRFAGHTDWRLPAKQDLESLIDKARSSPGILPSFVRGCGPGCSNRACNCDAASFYWSASTNADYPAGAWYVVTDNGDAGSYNKTNRLCVRAVRSGS